ncbi:hypothetical protein [Deinococcus koreensis]|uniref:Uncharacterized protein n=1 Tax=Deinococcus koreensis TaxID=2054903 RepID=A0A2K3V0Y5_9DEIO|nr:hypothetical protein [Deinococcus koreensis]PNY82436.1 hypothetical protein CVO96_14735 [Deinococcus koreensis]
MTDFAPGQRWLYRTRPGEDTSTALILGREAVPQGEVLHLCLDGLTLLNPLMDGGVQTSLAHVPVTGDALRASVETLIEVGVPLPPDTSPIDRWSEEARRGEAGAFTLPLAEIVGALEQAIASHDGAALLFQKVNLKERLWHQA